MKYYGLNKNSFKYKATSAFTALTIFVQSLAWSMYGVVINGVVINTVVSTPFNLAYAQEDNALLDNLRAKYQLADPANNYQGTETLDEVSSKEYEQSGRNLEGEIIDKYYVNPETSSGSLDMSVYHDPDYSFTDTLSNNLSAIQQTQVLSTPASINSSNEIELNLPPKKNITFDRNAEGDIVFNEDSNGNIIAVEEDVTPVTLAQEEIASSEYTHDQTSNAAGDIEQVGDKFVSNNYHDENNYYEEGTDQIEALETGTTSNALVYKTLLEANESNPAPTISAQNPLLIASNNALRDARDGNGSWGAECQEVTTTN